ncbi:hypothetical protein PCE1_002428 [Barthelona sp. PCE]
MQKILNEFDLFQALSTEHQQRYTSYEDRQNRYVDSVGANQAFFRLLLSFTDVYLNYEGNFEIDENIQPDPVQHQKNQQIFGLIAREWSAEYATERDESFGVLLNTLKENVPCTDDVAVLIPGSACGRLGWEVSKLGYNSIMNEFGFQMQLLSNLFLNVVNKPESLTMYPYIHDACNHVSLDTMFRRVLVPDQCPVMEGSEENGEMSLLCGEFVATFSKEQYKDSFDCIMSCFFLDTAVNIFEYFDTIVHCLKPGGILTNIGPLAWHWKDKSIELTFLEIKEILEGYGFEFLELDMKETTYASCEHSLMPTVYETVYFVAKLN